MHRGLTVLLAAGCAAAAWAGSPLRIETQGDWNAGRGDVHKVLRSAAAPLWRQFPQRDLAPIHISPKGGPIVLFRRGEDGSYRVKLDTGDSYWSQYAYQFSHEFCHILCNYREGGAHNKWFEEALCELASIYSLRRMAEDWAETPPYPNWRGYSTSLESYAQDLVDKADKPGDLAGWYRANRVRLEARADDRPRNRVVAVALLPMFEAEPELWQAVAYLNRSPTWKDDDFEAHLRAWRHHAPRRFGPAIERIAARLGFEDLGEAD